jgi:hypothetical protein
MSAATGSDQMDYTISERLADGYWGRDREGHDCILQPITAPGLPPGRVTGGVRLSFHDKVDVRWKSQTMSTPMAIMTCNDASLGHTFRVLGDDLTAQVRDLGHTPTGYELVDIFAEWQELLRARKLLSRMEETGLWGELWLLREMDNVDSGIGAWRGPLAAQVDFVGGGIGIECKTSFRKHIHHFSQDQLTKPLGDTDVYVISLWVEHDETAGEKLSSMVAAVRQRARDLTTFEKRLAKVGYSEADSAEYQLCLRLLEPPHWFHLKDVPRIREADPGVTLIVFEASLHGIRPLPPAQGIAALHRIEGGG